MLWQLHHQFKDGHTEFMAQVDVGIQEMGDSRWSQLFVDRTVDAHPLPKGATWLMCNEKAEQFIRQEVPDCDPIQKPQVPCLCSQMI
jgi:hypothetical protein